MNRNMLARLVGLAVVTALAFAAVAAAQDASGQPTPAAVGEVITLGADTEIHRDDLGGVGSWGVTEDDAATITIADGVLRFSISRAPLARSSWLELGVEAPVLWVRAVVAMSAERGAAGPMCGTSGPTPSALFGIVNTDGEWVVGRTVDSDLAVLARGPLPPALVLTQGGVAIVSVECAVTGASGTRVAVWVDGVNVADVTLPEALGDFSRVGLFADGYDEAFEVTFDDVVVARGATYEPRVRAPVSPLPSPVASLAPSSPALASLAPVAPAGSDPDPLGELLSHIPEAIRGSCEPVTQVPGRVRVKCSPVAGVESAGYFRYESLESLDTAFELMLDTSDAAAQGTDCSVGPALTSYTVDGQTAGTLACYEDGDLAVALWTNRDLRIIGIGVKTGGDFGTLYRWWQSAGPTR